VNRSWSSTASNESHPGFRARGRRFVHPAAVSIASTIGPGILLTALLILLVGPKVIEASEPAPARAQNISLLGQIGGACRTLAIGDGRVLISQGARLTEIDLADVAQPRPAGSLLLPAMVQSIAVRGNLAFVLADGLRVVDISDLQAFREISYLKVAGSRVTADGNFLYVTGAAPDLSLIDVTDPLRPGLAAAFDLPHSSVDGRECTGVVVRGRYAYVSYIRRILSMVFPPTGGMAVVDVGEPKNPRVLFDYPALPPANGIALDGDALYVTTLGAFFTFDAHDPRLPLLENRLPGPPSPADVCAADGRAYVATNASEIWVFQHDAADSTRELLRARLPDPVLALGAYGDYLLTAGGPSGLHVLDRVLSGNFSREVGRLDTLGNARDVAVEGHHAYVADGKSGLRIVDVSAVDCPVEIACFRTSASAESVVVHDALAYVAADQAGLIIVDVAAPERPVLVSALRLPGAALDLTLFGRFALVAAGSGGLALVDVIDPARPALFGRFTAAVYARSVTAVDDHAYVCDSGVQGYWVVNISSPLAPVGRKVITTAASPTEVAYDGAQLAVAESDRGLSLFDIRHRANPQRLGAVRPSGWSQGLALAGGLAFLADSRFGLRVASLIDPRRPAEIGFFATAGLPQDVAVRDSTAFLAAGEAGLYILQHHWSPDLALLDFDFAPQRVVAGDELFLTGTIANQAPTTTSAGVWVDVLISRRADFSLPRQRLTPRLRIEPGVTARDVIRLADHRFVVLTGVPPGRYFLGVVVDANNELAEFREDNNIQWSPQRIYVGPNVTAVPRWTSYE